jgi:hypothetical protein
MKNSTLIPTKLTIAGIPITIEIRKAASENERCIGHADYQNQKIILVCDIVEKELFEQTYFHELIHWILYIMGKPELRDDEGFVDLFAHLLYQAVSTAE